jgi:hypothetical protein
MSLNTRCGGCGVLIVVASVRADPPTEIDGAVNP